MIFVTIYILNSLWGNLETWRLALYSYYLILGLSGIAISYWIVADGKQIKHYATNIKKLEKRFQELEQKIRTIKPSIPKKK